MRRLALLPILAVLLVAIGVGAALVSYPAMLPLALAGAGIVLAILTLKE
jgi:hypothetical protein